MIVRGSNVIVLINVASTWTPYACAVGATFNVVTDMIETSVSGTGLFATFLPTKHSFTISMQGIVSLEQPAKLSLADLRKKQLNQDKLQIRFQRTDDAGNDYSEECYGYISSSSDTGTFDGVQTFSIEIRGTGLIIQSSWS